MPRIDYYPPEHFLIHTFVENISYAIFTQIGLDTDKLQITRNVVRERIYLCPLFMHNMLCKTIEEIKQSFDNYIADCIDEVLRRIS